jgi:hypothetical protein
VLFNGAAALLKNCERLDGRGNAFLVPRKSCHRALYGRVRHDVFAMRDARGPCCQNARLDGCLLMPIGRARVRRQGVSIARKASFGGATSLAEQRKNGAVNRYVFAPSSMFERHPVGANCSLLTCESACPENTVVERVVFPNPRGRNGIPRRIRLDVRTSFSDQPRNRGFRERNGMSMDTTSAAVVPLAQRDAIDMIIAGIRPGLISLFHLKTTTPAHGLGPAVVRAAVRRSAMR